MAKKKDLYNTLGVDKKASDEDIKKAYRKQASINHPDKQGGDNDKMTELTHAYKILGKKKNRDHYDSTGEEQETPFEARFQEFIQTFFIKIIENEANIENVDMIEKLKKMAKLNISEVKNGKGDLESKLAKLNKAAERLTAKKENRIAYILQINIDNHKQNIATADDHIKFMGEVLEVLSNYDYQFDPSPTPQGYFQVKGRQTRSLDGISMDDLLNAWNIK